MNILNVSQNYYVKGGSDAYMFALEELLSEYGHQVIPFCGENEKNLVSQWDSYFPKCSGFENGSYENILNYFYNVDARKKIHQLTNAIDINLAHLHIYYGKITSSVLNVLHDKKIPIVQTLHEYKLVCPVYTLERNGEVCEKCLSSSKFNCVKYRCKDKSVIKSIARYLEFSISRLLGDIDLIDKFISVSEFHRRKMIEGGVPEEKIVTIHNFVDTDQTSPAYHCGDYALYFGRVESLKGIKTLIDAAQIANVKLFIVGTGNDLDYFKCYAEKQKVNNVKFLGFKAGDELRYLIANCRFVVIPSEWYENCPMSVLEAKAYGKPVIGSDMGGIPELINHEKDGFIFKAKDVIALSDIMSFLFKEKDITEFSINSRLDAEVRFSKKMHYDKLINVYKDVI